jgi:serine/threonine-protein kinase
MALAVGRVLGNYVLRSVIGRGGQSEVFAAEHRFLGDRVAIKVLHPHRARDQAQVARFVQEAARTRTIEHPSVVRVLDFGSTDDEEAALYLVMERLDGETLAARIRRQGRLDEAEVRRIGAAVADGLQAAHERGIVHRDLKPANVVLLADGQPKIVDFGIAKVLGDTPAATGPGIGTPAYMAPEQLTGGVVGPCIDVWALGVVLYEALTGKWPFDGFEDGRCPQLFETAPEVGARVAVSAELAALIGECLRKGPAERPRSMREVAERLRGHPSVDERPTEPASSAPRAVARGAARRSMVRRRTTQAAAALVVLAAALIGWRVVERRARPAYVVEPVPGGATVDPTAKAAAPEAATAAPEAATAVPAPEPAPPQAAPAVAPARAAASRGKHRTPAPAHERRSRIYGEKLD